MRSKSSPTARPSSFPAPPASQPKVGSPVWAYLTNYPWWPARVVSRSQLSLDPDEPEPIVRHGQMLVQFFNDNNRFEVMDMKNIRVFYEDTEGKFNPQYTGIYYDDLMAAISEMKIYVEDIGWDETSAKASKESAVSSDRDIVNDALDVTSRKKTSSDPQEGNKRHPDEDTVVIADHDNDAPNPVLAKVDDVRAAAIDADDVEFVFNNTGGIRDEFADGEKAARDADAVEAGEVICVEQDAEAQGAGSAREIDEGTGGKETLADGHVEEAVTHGAGSARAGPSSLSQGGGQGSEAVGRVNGTGGVRISKKKPLSDDTSTESLPINESRLEEDSGMNKSAVPGGKRKFEEGEAARKKALPGAKPGADSSKPRKRKKKNGAEEQTSGVKVSSKVGGSGQKNRGVVGNGAKGVVKEMRNEGKAKKAGRSSTGVGNGGEKTGVTGKMQTTEKEMQNALRMRDEKIAGLQARIGKLEGDEAGRTGRELVSNGLELIQPAKEMLKSAQDMLKSAHEMIKEGQAMMKRGG